MGTPSFSEDAARRIDELFAHRRAVQKELDEAEFAGDEIAAESCYQVIEDDAAEITGLSEGLVRHYVRRFIGASREHEDDLCQAGRLGLVEAMDDFDPDQGRWSSWAGRFVLREVHRAVQAYDHPLLTERQFRSRQEVLRALRDLQRETGAPPSYEDVAKRAGVTVKVATSVIEIDMADRSLDDPAAWEELDALVGAADARTHADQDPFLDDRLMEELKVLTADMPPEQLFVFLRRYMGPESFHGNPPPTLAVVGNAMGKNREWARRRELAVKQHFAAKGIVLPEL